jgi:hypothetical protein
MGLLNYTTKIDADKTAGEITRCLASHGASSILTDYTDGILSAISFSITMGERRIGFRLPCDWRPVFAIITKGRKKPSEWDKARFARWKSEWEMQAVRTAWRIVKDWIEAQMALVETQMVTTQQVFLPYAVMGDGRTLSEHVASDPGFLLGEGKKDEPQNDL